MSSGASVPSLNTVGSSPAPVQDAGKASKPGKLNAKFFVAHTKPGMVQFMTENLWPKHGAGALMKKKAARRYLAGVEIRRLGEGHPLSGEQGLFATQSFELCDVIGEYVGVVRNAGVGEYTACLEDGPHSEVLTLDALSSGNEARFINSCVGIGDEKPNVVMKTAYLETLPRILIIACRNIEIGEELLLDYGEAYTRAYFQGPDKGGEGTTATTAPVVEDAKEDIDWEELSPVQKEEGDY